MNSFLSMILKTTLKLYNFINFKTSSTSIQNIHFLFLVYMWNTKSNILKCFKTRYYCEQGIAYKIILFEYLLLVLNDLKMCYCEAVFPKSIIRTFFYSALKGIQQILFAKARIWTEIFINVALQKSSKITYNTKIKQNRSQRNN